MKQLDLEKVHQVLSKVVEKYQKEEDSEIIEGIEHFYHDFEQFIKDFCFRFEDDYLIIFNNDPIPYEEYANDKYIYLPLVLLNYNDNEIYEWMCKREGEVLQNNRQILQEEITNTERKIEALKVRLQYMKENIS